MAVVVVTSSVMNFSEGSLSAVQHTGVAVSPPVKREGAAFAEGGDAKNGCDGDTTAGGATAGAAVVGGGGDDVNVDFVSALTAAAVGSTNGVVVAIDVSDAAASAVAVTVGDAAVTVVVVATAADVAAIAVIASIGVVLVVVIACGRGGMDAIVVLVWPSSCWRGAGGGKEDDRRSGFVHSSSAAFARVLAVSVWRIFAWSVSTTLAPSLAATCG